jgi:uncharacterized protein (TIGR04255 family)
MDAPMPQLKNSPIVEAVINLDCDMPSTMDFTSLEVLARKALPEYQKSKAVQGQNVHIEAKLAQQPEVSAKQSLMGLQLLLPDEKQLVQFRRNGFSFNRLAPYSSLDNYLSEIERTWNVFLTLTKPLQVRSVQLRYLP